MPWLGGIGDRRMGQEVIVKNRIYISYPWKSESYVLKNGLYDIWNLRWIHQLRHVHVNVCFVLLLELLVQGTALNANAAHVSSWILRCSKLRTQSFAVCISIHYHCNVLFQ